MDQAQRHCLYCLLASLAEVALLICLSSWCYWSTLMRLHLKTWLERKLQGLVAFSPSFFFYFYVGNVFHNQHLISLHHNTASSACVVRSSSEWSKESHLPSNCHLRFRVGKRRLGKKPKFSRRTNGSRHLGDTSIKKKVMAHGNRKITHI